MKALKLNLGNKYAKELLYIDIKTLIALGNFRTNDIFCKNK